MKKLFLLLLVLCIFAPESFARAGGGRSFGSRGSRGVSPRAPYSQPYRQPGYTNRAAPAPGYQAPPPPASFGGGGFMRNMAAGIAGGFLGSMLFRSTGWAGNGIGGGGGGGIGLLEILLLALVGFLAFRWFRNRATATQYASTGAPFQPSVLAPLPSISPQEEVGSVVGADTAAFKEARVDDFFRLQAAIMNRELSHVRHCLTPEMASVLESDIQLLKSKGQINRIESIAVRESEIVEAWQEAGQDFATLHLKASLLDFTVDEKSGTVVGGDPNTPVKFDEYWTFVRPQGTFGVSDWKLTAIENNA